MTATLDLGTGFTDALRAVVREELAAALDGTAPRAPDDPLRWRALLWAGDPALRLSARELAAALGCSRQQVYRHVAAGLPARRRHGALLFVVGECRTWLVRAEQVMT